MTVTLVTVFILIVVLVIGFVGVTLISLITKKSMNEQKTKAFDVFMYLGIGISLIISVANFLQILFRAIEEKYPDILEGQRYVDAFNDDIRMSIATLVVMFPMYIGLSIYINRDIKNYLYKRDLMVRKLFSYVAIFVTLLTLVGTLVSIIYTYLGGEISTRFELKALSVFVVALSVFAYYFYTLKRDFVKEVKWPKISLVASILLVVLSLAWSISIVGSPAVMRARRIDNTRLSALSNIQQEVNSKVQIGDKLPENLEALSNAFHGYVAPYDPVTKEQYGYTVLQQPTFTTNYQTGRKTMVTPAIFELCATFGTVRVYDQNTMTPPMGMSSDSLFSVSNYYYEGDVSPFWNHKAGRTCFRRVISPEMYYGK